MGSYDGPDRRYNGRTTCIITSDRKYSRPDLQPLQLAMRVVWMVLCLVQLTLLQQCSRDEACAMDSSMCGLESILRPDIEKSSSAVQVILDRVPHRIFVANTSGIHLSVKTAAKYHEQRLSLVLLTWLQTVQPRQVHIVTDDMPQDKWTATAGKYGFKITMATGCPMGHCRDCLCCKSGAEFEQYYSEKEFGSENTLWFCHVDDDVYVNTRQLIALLEQYNPLEETVYLGRWSLSQKSKMQIDHFRSQNIPNLKTNEFAFGTGALYCISATIMTELEPYLRGTEKFRSTCKLLQYTDDMTIGATIEAILGYNFTDVDSIYSQFHSLKSIPAYKLPNIVSISYGEFIVPGGNVMRRVTIPRARFTVEQDPTRFLSYHCLIHPITSWCH